MEKGWFKKYIKNTYNNNLTFNIIFHGARDT